ncbi:FAD-dependent monooxygenase sorC [Vanrija pseudolonga]|uniref:FAD-dependent monooxygenase sorC n=1 Tax=Vanrija pseudolonga TaxID=143232 RepID=A0AAF0Y8E5_9TREE|nr:FAD-dependent monooxygenase sorC [Vanrija pseudolonga]
MTNPTAPTPPKVAIIGGGPAGLGTAIALGQAGLAYTLYEAKPAISEIGNGISVQRNTWRMLEALGASRNLTRDKLFRAPSGHDLEHRNGHTGALVATNDADPLAPPHQQHARVHRAHLQQALLRQVDASRIRTAHKLVSVSTLPSGRLRLAFANGFEDEVDLLVGADGIRSVRRPSPPPLTPPQVVRAHAFPDHKIAYAGATSYRTLVPATSAALVNGLPDASTFWHGTDRKWVYSCPLGPHLEITTSIKEADDGQRGSWGRRSSVAAFRAAFAEMCQPVQELLRLATFVEQYDYFAGPRLESVVQPGIALVGDASHPLSGAFGAGAGFALEDAWTLGQSVRWASAKGLPLDTALALFDAVRSPHYADLYAVLDGYRAADADVAAARLPPAGEIKAVVERNWSDRTRWMLVYEVDAVFAREIARHEAEVRKGAGEGGTVSQRNGNGHGLTGAAVVESERQLNGDDLDSRTRPGHDLPDALHAVRVA